MVGALLAALVAALATNPGCVCVLKVGKYISKWKKA